MIRLYTGTMGATTHSRSTGTAGVVRAGVSVDGAASADANDYSRFEQFADPDEESLFDAAKAEKDAGNRSFQAVDFDGAIGRYTEPGLKAVERRRRTPRRPARPPSRRGPSRRCAVQPRCLPSEAAEVPEKHR